MIVPILTLPKLRHDTVAARRRLGRGLRLAFQVAGQRGELRLEPGRSPTRVDSLGLETACGALVLAEAGPLLSLLGECPVPLAQFGNDPDSWFWDLFHYHLSPQVKALLGSVRLLEKWTEPRVLAVASAQLWARLGWMVMCGWPPKPSWLCVRLGLGVSRLRRCRHRLNWQLP